MTQTEAREALAETWRFGRSNDLIVVQEVRLIEAVRALEANRSPDASATFGYAEIRAPSSP